MEGMQKQAQAQQAQAQAQAQAAQAYTFIYNKAILSDKQRRVFHSCGAMTALFYNN